MSRRIKISIENLHSRYRINKKKIADLAERILRSEKSNSSLDIILVQDSFIRKLNRDFRKKDNTTDVLSFGMTEGKRIGQEMNYLGDIYICLDQAKRQSKEYKIPFMEELYRLVVHGVLHLLGYEHKTLKQKKKMTEMENYFVARTQGKKK